MTEKLNSLNVCTWHTDDLLVRIAHAEPVSHSETHDALVSPPSPVVPATDINFGQATLSLISEDAELVERHSVLRSNAFNDDQLVAFGARERSRWALDTLIGRKTGYRQDWASFRAAIIADSNGTGGSDYVLGRVTLNDLWRVIELIHERNMDPVAESALLQYMARTLLAGGSLKSQLRVPFVERLLQNGLGKEAREVIPSLPSHDWMRHALTADSHHPRYGGTFDAMLRVWNEPYRRLALEPLSLSADETIVPFHRLVSSPSTSHEGPLVTVIMSCWNPGNELITAVASIVAQTYGNWELIVTDDASPMDVDDILNQVAALDPRIRVIRNETNAGTYVRRNEAINLARGEFVTMQDSDDWSHPRRLAIQAQDLVANPFRLANVVNAARLTAQLSISHRGAKLYLAEPSLMFRREAVIRAIGYYDSVRKSADTEFRKRLQVATRRPIPTVTPGIPLMLMLADESSLSGADFGSNIWNHPDRLIYWSATKQHLSRIESGVEDPFLPFPLPQRPFHAPARWTATPQTPSKYDLVVVLDARASSHLDRFHATVAAEIRAAASAGMQTAVIQADSVTGPRGMALFTADLQALVDQGTVNRITSDEPVAADLVVVRHAIAAQGHEPDAWAVRANRVVVIEDSAGGDARMVTMAKQEVRSTVTAWFGFAPEWLVSPPMLPPVSITSVDTTNGKLGLTLSADFPPAFTHLTINGLAAGPLASANAPDPTQRIYTLELCDLPSGELTVTAHYTADEGEAPLTQLCSIVHSAVIWNGSEKIAYVSGDGALTLIDAADSRLEQVSAPFSTDSLSASISRISVLDDDIEIFATETNSTMLTAVYAMRKADEHTTRRREFSLATTDSGAKAWRRPLTKFTDSPWQVFGSFRTSFGQVEFPLAIDKDVELVGTDDWQPSTLQGGRVQVNAAPVLTQGPARSSLVSRNRLVAAVRTRFRGGRPSDSAEVTHEHSSTDELKGKRTRLDPSYGAPRISPDPTVSVIMPVYNVEPYLEVAIESVLNQDFTDLELVIVDDASTDNSRDIIEHYWHQDPRVRVFALDHNTLGGAGIPSNIGIRAARGKYIAFADSDDYLTTSGLSSMIELAEKHDAELVVGDFQTFSDGSQDGERAYDHAVWNEFPLNTPISAFTHPALFRLSPVPWRKLYRRDFLEAHSILYPEGDYFYEDNPLHWFVLSRAHRVVATTNVISFHRQEREGQTTSAQAYKLGAFVNHANTVFNFISASTDLHRDVLFEAFFAYLDRTNWTVKSQTQPASAALIRRGLGELFDRAVAAAPDVPVPPLIRAQLATYRSAYPDIDLTIVIPVFNSADLLRQTLESVVKLKGINYNVLIVDDGSTDESLTVMREFENLYANVHAFAQGNRGAGRARNSVIPLCTGRYTFFLDADDVVAADALAAAVMHADAESADLVFVKYRIDYFDETRSTGMFKSDQQLWSSLRTLRSSEEQYRVFAQLINYPWNRIIRTSLLHDANIFFGATVVHNDVLFHWHTISSAKKLAYLDVEVVSHRKFAEREQVTNISDGRRLAVVEALRNTHERISSLEQFEGIQDEWRKFATHLLDWAEDRIPADLRSEYNIRKGEFIASIAD